MLTIVLSTDMKHLKRIVYYFATLLYGHFITLVKARQTVTNWNVEGMWDLDNEVNEDYYDRRHKQDSVK